MVRIRLSRGGSKKAPFYRIVVTDHRNKRDGDFLENVGTFDPCKVPELISVKAERLAYWTSKGAQLSPTVSGLLKKHAKATTPVNA